MATLTTVYDFYLPVIGGDIDVWGGFHNDNFEKLDDLLSGVQTITPDLGSGWKVGGVAVSSSAAELNLLDGITATTAELNKLAGLTATTAELNKLAGYTGTTADLNILSGASAAGLTAAELLYVNGVTSAIQTQLNGKQATLGFTPVEQGGGVGQLSNKINLGWDTGTLRLSVDGSDLGRLVRNTAAAAGANGELIAPGSAPLYAARAWVNIIGQGTVGARSAGNVSSLTDNGVGDYTINFTTAIPDASYAVVGAASALTGAAGIVSSRVGASDFDKTTTSVRIVTYKDNGSVDDFSSVNVVIFR